MTGFQKVEITGSFLSFFLAGQLADALSHGWGQLADNSTANSLDRIAEVVAAQPGTVQAIMENGNHRTSEAQQELVRASQGVATKPMAASPFDSPPLQQVIRLEVHELVE